MSAYPVVSLPRERWGEFRRRTVAATSLALLHHVAATSDCGRTVGLAYSHIVEVVRSLHPGARTTAHSLRWYRSKVVEGEPGFAVEGARLPQARPRSPVVLKTDY